MKLKEIFPETGGALAIPTPAQSEALMVVDLATRQASATQALYQLKADALTLARTVQQVANADEQNRAVEAQAALAKYVRVVDNAAEAVKKPLNALRTNIIDLNKKLVAEAEIAGNRIGSLISEFQIAEEKRVAALRRLADEQASALERERDAELAKAKTVEEQDAIQDSYRDALASNIPAPEPARAQGQVVREDWDITVTDIWLLARAKPSCVKIEPRLSEIKSLLNAGVKVEGVSARKITKASVRLRAEPEAINV